MTNRMRPSHEGDPRETPADDPRRQTDWPIPSKPMSLGRGLPKRSSGMMMGILI